MQAGSPRPLLLFTLGSWWHEARHTHLVYFILTGWPHLPLCHRQTGQLWLLWQLRKHQFCPSSTRPPRWFHADAPSYPSQFCDLCITTFGKGGSDDTLAQATAGMASQPTLPQGAAKSKN